MDTFIVPISAQKPSANVINLWASFTDNDPSLFDDADTLCIATAQIHKSSQEWQNLSNPERIQISCDENGKYDFDAKGFITVSVRGLIAPPGSP